jgi:hypothetical protein
MLSGTLLSDHLTPEEFSSLSYQDRSLVRAVKILIPSKEEKRKRLVEEVETIYDGLVGFECAYCASSPVMAVMPRKTRALFHEVFPGSIQSMGAALHLLRDKHYSSEAAQFQQRCLFLPSSERRIFDQKDYRIISQATDLSLQTCCERVAYRLGIINKGSSKEKSGIILDAEQQRKPTPSAQSTDKKRGREENLELQDTYGGTAARKRHYSGEQEMLFPYSRDAKEGGALSSIPQMSQTLSPPHAYSSLGLAGLHYSSQGITSATQPYARAEIAPPPVSPYVAPFYARIAGLTHEEGDGNLLGLRGRTSSIIANRSPGMDTVGSVHERNPISPMSHTTTTSRQASPLSFVHDGLGWACPHCLHIPFSLRASGSFHQHEPSREEAYSHFRRCNGLRQHSTQSPQPTHGSKI